MTPWRLFFAMVKVPVKVEGPQASPVFGGGWNRRPCEIFAGSVRQATDRRTCKLSPGGNRSSVGDAHQRTAPGNSLLGRPCDQHLPRKSVNAMVFDGGRIHLSRVKHTMTVQAKYEDPKRYIQDHKRYKPWADRRCNQTTHVMLRMIAQRIIGCDAPF